jgi:NTE family protein
METIDLVLEGGGVKGIALVGAVAALERAGYSTSAIGRVAGTSAGALVGALVAAGFTADELERTMREVDLRTFRESSRFGAVGNLASLITRLGLYRGDRLHAWIETQLAKRGIRTFGDLRITADPDSALTADRSYRLVVVVSDVSRGRMLRLPWDYQHYGLDPDTQLVADAVRASASIPFYFRPAKLTDGQGQPSVCADGGMLSNFPVNLFDRNDGQPPRWPTFGVKLSVRPSSSPWPSDGPPVRGLLSLTKALIGTMINAHDRMFFDDPAICDRVIFVDSTGTNATNFDLDTAAKDLLYNRGHAAAEAFLESWDFERYLSKYAPRGQQSHV